MKARQLIAGLVLVAASAVASAGTFVSVGVPGMAVTHVSGNTVMSFNTAPAAPAYYGGHHHHHMRPAYAPAYAPAYDPRMYRPAPVYVAPAPVYVEPAPVYVAPAPVVAPDYYAGARRQQQMQDLVNMCADPRTTRACSLVDGQNVCITCNN